MRPLEFRRAFRTGGSLLGGRMHNLERFESCFERLHRDWGNYLEIDGLMA